jgi:hypothetical protein
MSTLGAVLLAGVAGLLTATLLVDWVVVDVHVVDVSHHNSVDFDSPVHIKVPFPLAIADLAVGFIPDDVFDEAEIPPEATAQRELVLATIGALLEAPDATLVKGRTDEANVDIEKEGDNLLVAVDADGAIVRCKVPIDGVFRALENWDWKSADPDLLFDVLHSADNGEMVTVTTEDGVRVAVKMW